MVAQEDALGGFVPRWVVKQLDRGRSVPFPERPNQGLIQPLAEHLRKANQLRGEADLSGIRGYYEQWYVKTQRRFSEHPNSALAMPNRLRTHVLKLAVIYEVSQSLGLKVRPRALGRAIKAAKASEVAIFRLMATGLSREGAEVGRITEVITQAGPEGISRSELTRVFQHLRNNERESRLATLLEAKTGTSLLARNIGQKSSHIRSQRLLGGI